MYPNILNYGTVNLPLTLSQVFTAAGLVTDGLGNNQLQGNWIRATNQSITYQVVSQNPAFIGGAVQAIILGK